MKSVKNVLETLTLDEKIRLLNGVGSWETYDCNSKVPVISMSDGPHGLRRQTSGETYTNINDSNVATCFPTASAIASSWNTECASKMGKAIAKEAKAENVQIMLGCGMNIKRTPLCGRNFEYFSEDPLLSGKIAGAYVKGMQKENVGACIKHFALNNQEKNRQSSSSNVDERTLREIYLKGFEIAVRESDPVAIMSSYNLINGKYASANKHLLTELLRNQWHFNGIVISDWGADIDPGESLKAGLDIGMPDSMGYFQKRLKKDLADGVITESDIDAACERIISKALYFEEHKEEFAGGSKCTKPDYSEQHRIALELALESAVLLKNDGALPLKEKSSVAALGTFAENTRFQGGGSSHITTQEYPNIIEELSKDFSVQFESGYNKKSLALVKKCVEENADIPVLFFCGLDDTSEGEGFDRENISLPAEQIKLYREIRSVTKNIILVTFGGSPFDLSFALEKNCEARAILHMYLCGEACARACAMLLSGKKNPSGKLAETWPLENAYLKPDEEYDINYREGVLVGYRYYETKNKPVLFEFGYGLSYTSFEYSDLRVEECSGEQKNEGALYNVSLTVRNTGACAGAEVVQLYVKNAAVAPENECVQEKVSATPVNAAEAESVSGAETSSAAPVNAAEAESVSGAEKISRPAIELRDFTKVYLDPGESKTVTFTLTGDAFSVYSDKEGAFRTAGGTYEICAASSVKKINLSAKVNVTGKNLSELVSPDSVLQQKVFVQHARHKKGEFDGTDSLSFMAKSSVFARIFLKVMRFLVVATSPSKSAEDPAVKISLCGLCENPLESFISTAPDTFTEKFVNKILKRANRGARKPRK